MFAYAITESRPGKRYIGVPACPLCGTGTLLRRDGQHKNLPTLRWPEALG